MRNSDANSAQPSNLKTYKLRLRLLKLLCVSTLGMGLLIIACDYRNPGHAPKMEPKKESNIDNIKSKATISDRIPPIDAALPDEVKTATFALG